MSNSITAPITLARDAYQLAVAAGFDGTFSDWQESHRGPQGLKGDKGNQGEKGDTGQKGDTGAKGDRGEKGDQVAGGLGDIDITDLLIIACGDSGTERLNVGVGGSSMIATLRAKGGAWEKIRGFVNFGGSGNTLNAFVSSAVGTLPVVDPDNNLGANSWDYYGHKPTGAVNLETALVWREGKAKNVLWRVSFGRNDLTLTNTHGSQSQEYITDYLATRLRTAVNRIHAVYPNDPIVLDLPCPMTARPYTGVSPSPSAYPWFGDDEATDQAFCEKLNQGLRGAYMAVRNEFGKTVVFDSWKHIFGSSDPSKPARTGQPFMDDTVHATSEADRYRITEFAKLLDPNFSGYERARVREAVLRAPLMGLQPWELNAEVLENALNFRKVLDTTVASIASTRIDLGVTFSEWKRRRIAAPVYIAIGNVAQYFPSFSAALLGPNTTRLTSVNPSDILLSSTGRVRIYAAATEFIANDEYVHTAAVAAREYCVVTLGGGTNYIDITAPTSSGAFSSYYPGGLTRAKLAIGGGVDVTIDLSSASSISRQGTRRVRALITGSFSDYSGKPAAVFVGDEAPGLRSQELIPPVSCFLIHAQNSTAYLKTEIPMPWGGVFKANRYGPAIPSAITVEIYSQSGATRTLLGTITIPANGGTATMAAGNPTTAISGALIFEAVVTSNTTSTSPLVITLTPNNPA
jgi:hypothetical protein